MASSSHVASKILRGSLRSKPGPGGAPGRFHLPCRKLVLQYNDSWPSSRGARDFVLRGLLADVAASNPSVEVVMLEKAHRHPLVQGFYVNGREKTISLRNLPQHTVAEKVQLCLDSSGRKMTNLKQSTVVAGAEESARGIWSSMHLPTRPRRD